MQAVTHKATFPEELEIQVSDESIKNFFGTTTSVVADIVKVLQQSNQVVIVGLLGDMAFYNTVPEVEQKVVKEEATNLFDKVVAVDHFRTKPNDIQEELGRELGMVYEEAEVQGRAERLRKTLLTYIRNKRLLLILRGVKDQGILEAAGIPPLDGVDPKHFKIILISYAKENLLKMGVKLPNIIPIGSFEGDRWMLFLNDLQNNSEKVYPTLLQQQEEEGEDPYSFDTNTDICSFVGPDTLLLNNIIKSLLSSHNQIIGMLGSRSDLHELYWEVNFLLKYISDELVRPHGNEVDTIQEILEKSLGIITSSSSSETADGGRLSRARTYKLQHENKARCIRQTLISMTSSAHDKKRLILILNDLSKEVDLEAVGIPPPDELDPKFFKILLTSDSKQVLQKMGAQQIFKRGSEPLKEYSFYRILNGYLERSELVKLADECGSNDLATLLAKKIKDQGMHAWANAFRRLKESPFVYEERKKVIDSL